MSNGILVFIEHKGGALNKTSLEAIAAEFGREAAYRSARDLVMSDKL